MLDSRMRHDVVVIGGGPAGSTAAALLAKAGHDVLLLEADSHPRPHVGESLLPGIAPILQEMGALSAVESAGFGLKTGTTHWQWGATRQWDLWFRDSDQFDHAWLVDRGRFDKILFDTARSAGATAREQTRVREPILADDRVVGVKLRSRGGVDDEVARARFVIDASGQAALLSRKPGVRQHVDGLRHQASWAHYENAGRLPPPRENQALFVAEPGYWLWLFPFGQGRASVGMVRLDGAENLAARDSAFEKGILRSKAFRDVLGASARRATPIRHQRDFSYRMREVSGPGWLSAGDASGFIDPVLSTGVFLAMHAGRHSANLVSDVLHGRRSEEEALLNYSTHHRELFDDLLRMVRFYYQQNLDKNDYFWESKRILMRQDTELKPQKAFLILTSGLVRNLALSDAAQRALEQRKCAISGGAELERSPSGSVRPPPGSVRPPPGSVRPPPEHLGFLCVHLEYDDGSASLAQLYLLIEPTDPGAPSLFRTEHFDINCLAPRYDNDPISHPALEPHLRFLERRIRPLDTETTDSVVALWREKGGELERLFLELPAEFRIKRVFGE